MSNLGTGARSELTAYQLQAYAYIPYPYTPLKLDEVQAFLRNASPLHLGVPLSTRLLSFLL